VVNWTSAVDSSQQARMPGLFTAVTNSAYMDWLYEYDTAGRDAGGSNQFIGRGSYKSMITIAPSVTATTVTENQIGAELAAQIAAATLPAPSLDDGGNVNTLYVFAFPPGYTIMQASNRSCVQFC